MIFSHDLKLYKNSLNRIWYLEGFVIYHYYLNFSQYGF